MYPFKAGLDAFGPVHSLVVSPSVIFPLFVLFSCSINFLPRYVNWLNGAESLLWVVLHTTYYITHSSSFIYSSTSFCADRASSYLLNSLLLSLYLFNNS